MSTKTLKKELLAAVAMMLVALLALSGSTYAWFASNTKVTAETMTVTAASASPFLQIKQRDAADSTYSTAYTMVTSGALGVQSSGTGLKLIAPGTIGAASIPSQVDWYESVSTNPSVAVSSVNTTRTAVEGDTTQAAYFIKQKLTIKNSSNIDAENLEVMASFGAVGEDTLHDSVRVLIVTSDGAFACFDKSDKATDAGVVTQGAAVKGVGADKTVTLAAVIASNTAIDIDVYLYFDGNDPMAKNIATTSATYLNCGLIFTIKGDEKNSMTNH